MASLTELRVTWCALGGVAALAAALQLPSALPFALAAWVIGMALLVGSTGSAVRAGLEELAGRASGRMAAVALAALVLLTAVLAGTALALALACWIGAVSLVFSAVTRPSRFADLFTNVTLSIVMVAALAGVLEGIFRLPALARQFGTPQERARWERAYDHVEEGNAFHMRSRHVAVARRPGVRRILAVGDSWSWGDKVLTTDSLWPALLEGALLAASPAAPTEVLNLSHRGWNTVQEAIALNRLGWQFTPDRVILQFCSNDAEISRGEMEGASVRLRRAVASQMQLIQWSALLWIVKQTVAGNRGDSGLFQEFRDDAPGWQHMREAMREIADSAKARGVPVTAALFPEFRRGSWTPATYPLAPVYRKVADEARANGFDVLDLTSAYAAEGGDWSRWRATRWDGHPSAAAQLVAARALARHLDSLGWSRSAGEPAAAPGR